MGSRIRIVQDGREQFHWYQNGKTGFLAFSDPRIHFGLRNGQSKVKVEVRLASGAIKKYDNLDPGVYHKLKL